MLANAGVMTYTLLAKTEYRIVQNVTLPRENIGKFGNRPSIRQRLSHPKIVGVYVDMKRMRIHIAKVFPSKYTYRAITLMFSPANVLRYTVATHALAGISHKMFSIKATSIV